MLLPSWFSPMPSGDVHDVTFNLNMADETVVASSGVFVAGGSFFGVAGDHPMTDSDGDGTWTVTIPVPNGFTGYYTFLNGNCLDWSCKENIAGLECAHPENYNDRMLDNIRAERPRSAPALVSAPRMEPVRCGDRVHGCGGAQLPACGDRG